MDLERSSLFNNSPIKGVSYCIYKLRFHSLLPLKLTGFKKVHEHSCNDIKLRYVYQ